MIAMLSEARAADERDACRGRLLRFIGREGASGVIRRPRRITPALCDAPKPSRTSRPTPPPIHYHSNQQADRSGPVGPLTVIPGLF